MGLSNFPPSAEGVLLLPVLVMNTVMSIAFVKNLVRSVIQVMSASASASANSSSSVEEYDAENTRERRISITQFKSLRQSFNGGKENGSASTPRYVMAECCVCLCGFEADEEVSELSCKHIFHKGCLSKWFDNKHITCPLCRSIE